MPTTVDDLLVRVVVDSSGAVKGFETVSGSLNKASDSAEKSEGKMNLLEKTLGALGMKTIVVNQALELAKKAYEAIAEPIAKINEEYQAQLKNETLLQSALKLKGQYTQANMEQFKEFAEQLEAVTTASVSTTLGLAGLAKAQGMSDAQTKQYIKTAADLADLFDGDVSAAFQHLVMLQKGSDRELEMLFPALRGMSMEAKQAGAGFEFLSGKVKGFAQISASTRLGATKQLANAIEGVMVEIGRTFDEVFNRNPEQTKKIVKVLNDVKTAVINVRLVMLQMKDTLGKVDWENFAKSAEHLAIALGAVFAAIQVVKFVQFANSLGALSSMRDAAAGAQLFANAIGGSAMIQGLKRFVMSTAEVLAVAAAFIAIGAAVDIVARNLNRIPELFSVIGSSFAIVGKAIVRGFVGWSLAIDNLLVSALEKVSGTIFDVGGAATKALGHFRNLAMEDSDAIDKLNAGIGDSADNIKKAGKNIDTGFAGQALKMFNDLLDDTQKKIKEVKDKAKAGTGDGQIIDFNTMKEINDLLSQIKSETVAIDTETDNLNVGQIEAMENLAQAEKVQIELLKEKLANEGKLTKQIEMQLNMKKAAIDKNTNAKRDQMEHPQLIDKNQQETIKRTFGDAAGTLTKSISGALGSVSNVAGAVMGAVNGVLDFVQQLIDFVPQVLEKIAGIFNSLTDLPNKLVAGVQDVMKSLVNFAGNFIPNLLNSIPKILDTLVTGLFEQIPNAIMQLFNKLPDIINGIIDKLPEIISKLVKGMIENAPMMIAAFIKLIVKGVPKIVVELVKVLVKVLPGALAGAIRDAIKDIGSAFTGIFKAPKIDMSGVKKTIDDIGKAVNSFSNDVFSVVDMAASNQATTLASQIQGAMNDGAAYLEGIWKRLIALLKEAWQWVYDKIIEPIVNALRAVWQFVYDSILKPIIDAIRGVWDGIYNDIIKPFLNLLGDSWNALTAVFKDIWKNFIQPIGGVIAAPFKEIITFFRDIFQGKIGEAFQSIINFFKNTFGTLISAPFNTIMSVFNSLKTLSVPIFNDLKNAINHLFDTPGWLQSLIDAVNKATGGGGGGGGGGAATQTYHKLLGHALGGPILGFASGGGVPGAYSPSQIDNQLIRAQAGEFMMRREAVTQYGSGFMHQVNKGQYKPEDAAKQPSITIQKLEVNVTPQKLDDQYVTNQLAPKIMQQIQKESLRGKYIMDQKGVRK